MGEKFKDQLVEQEEQIAGLMKERDTAIQESQRLQAENESSMNEVKEVLQALEELAMNYDQKSQEAVSKEKENEALLEDLKKSAVSHHRTVNQSFDIRLLSEITSEYPNCQ